MKTLSFHDFKTGRSPSNPLIDIRHSEMSPGLHLIVAPNGYGKSTLLQCLAGVLPSNSGKVLFGQTELDAERDVLYISEYLTFPKFIYPSEWIEHVSHRSWDNELKEELKPWIQALSLEHKLDSYLGRMSQGERRKITWLAAHASRKPILLLDEPLDGLDLLAIRAARELISAWSQQDRILLLVAHQLSEVLDLAKQAWLIRNKKLEAWNGADLHTIGAEKFRSQILEFYL